MDDYREPIVITGIGMIASVGADREAVWQALCAGRTAVRFLTDVPFVPPGSIIGAAVDGLDPAWPHELKVISLCRAAAAEAVADSGLDFSALAPARLACAVSGHMGDTGELERPLGHYRRDEPDARQWWEQFLPNTACSMIANRYGLLGPRICHSVACASGLVDILAAFRSIRHGDADVALAGSAEAIHPLFAAGFQAMRVLAHHEDPAQASRPFDAHRNGFVMGEGAAMFVLERLGHAQARGAKVYAEIVSGKMLAAAHHVTGMDAQSDALVHAIRETLRLGELAPEQIDYINAHGTGTQQNDVAEIKAVQRALGPAAQQLCIGANKSALGHLVNAAGSVELALTALALRDGFAPPTLNLTNPDPDCDLDCVPLVGRRRPFEHALKLSVAFGGHLVAMALRRGRWQSQETALPAATRRAA